MNLSDLTEAEKIEILLSELQDAGQELQRWRCGDNRALRTVREMRQGVQDGGLKKPVKTIYDNHELRMT